MTIISKKTPFIIGGITVLFAVGGYIAVAMSGDTQTKDIILSGWFWVPMLVMIVAIFLGGWYTPQSRKALSLAAKAIMTLLLISIMAAVPELSPWLLSMVAIATVIIECAAVFLPVKSDTSKDDASKV